MAFVRRLLTTEPPKIVYVMPTADIRLGAFNNAGDDTSCPGAPDRKRAEALEKKMLCKDYCKMFDVTNKAKIAEMKVIAASKEGKIAVAVVTAHLNVCRTLSKIRAAKRKARRAAAEKEAKMAAAKHARHLALRASLGLDVAAVAAVAAVVPSRADKARQAHVERVLSIVNVKAKARKAKATAALPQMRF